MLRVLHEEPAFPVYSSPIFLPVALNLRRTSLNDVPDTSDKAAYVQLIDISTSSHEKPAVSGKIPDFG